VQHRFVVNMNLQKEAALLGFERTVEGARWPAGVGVWRKTLAPVAVGIIADYQIARDKVNFFPVIVYERRRGVNTRSKTQVPRAETTLAFFMRREAWNRRGLSRRSRTQRTGEASFCA
jgi:hypothetical protein